MEGLANPARAIAVHRKVRKMEGTKKKQIQNHTQAWRSPKERGSVLRVPLGLAPEAETERRLVTLTLRFTLTCLMVTASAMGMLSRSGRNLLLRAAEQGDARLIRLILSIGAEIDSFSPRSLPTGLTKPACTWHMAARMMPDKPHNPVTDKITKQTKSRRGLHEGDS